MKSAAKIFFFLLLFTFHHGAAAQSPEASLRDDVTFLSDSLCMGRGFGSKENLGTAFYINKAFRDAGLWTRFQIFHRDRMTGRNVIGITPGFYDNYIVVGAFFDGIGCIDGESGRTYYPGADSNASGVASLLHLARRLGRARTRTGIIFVAFDGHSEDLSGSKAFLEEFGRIYKLELMVNIDIIGSTAAPVKDGRPDYLIALGAGNFSWQLNSLNRETGLYLSFDYYGSSRFTDLFYRSMSDQKWFVEKKIPSVMFTSGITMDTNKMSDTADKLDYGVMARRVRLIELWLRRYLGITEPS